MAERGTSSMARKRKQDRSTLLTLIKRAYFTPAQAVGSLIPIGNVTSRASFREGSMSKMGGRGWSLRTGYMGSGAVVFPDTDESAKAFLQSVGRPLTDADREGWLVYADRIGMVPGVADRAWRAMTKPSLKPKLAEALAELRSVFEATSWWGYSVPHLFQTGQTRQGPMQMPTPLTNKDPKSKGKPGVTVTPIVSFPYHTKAARTVYEKALVLVGLYPLDNPMEIVRKAVSAVNINPVMDLTPEDEKLLYMAIEFAQNGPARSKGNKIGGAPGGPFNSTDSFGKRGAP